MKRVSIEYQLYISARNFCDDNNIRFKDFLESAIEEMMIPKSHDAIEILMTKNNPKKTTPKWMLKKGDRIKLKVRTFSGWKGYGIVIMDMSSKDDIVHFVKEEQPDDFFNCCAGRHEVVKCRR